MEAKDVFTIEVKIKASSLGSTAALRMLNFGSVLAATRAVIKDNVRGARDLACFDGKEAMLSADGEVLAGIIYKYPDEKELFN